MVTVEHLFVAYYFYCIRSPNTVLCTQCTGSGCAEGSSPTICDTCGGNGEIQSVQPEQAYVDAVTEAFAAAVDP